MFANYYTTALMHCELSCFFVSFIQIDWESIVWLLQSRGKRLSRVSIKSSYPLYIRLSWRTFPVGISQVRSPTKIEKRQKQREKGQTWWMTNRHFNRAVADGGEGNKAYWGNELEPSQSHLCHRMNSCYCFPLRRLLSPSAGSLENPG